MHEDQTNMEEQGWEGLWQAGAWMMKYEYGGTVWNKWGTKVIDTVKIMMDRHTYMIYMCCEEVTTVKDQTQTYLNNENYRI